MAVDSIRISRACKHAVHALQRCIPRKHAGILETAISCYNSRNLSRVKEA